MSILQAPRANLHDSNFTTKDTKNTKGEIYKRVRRGLRVLRAFVVKNQNEKKYNSPAWGLDRLVFFY